MTRPCWRASAGKPSALRGTLDGASGHPDEGMRCAVGDVLEALDLPETGPLVHGYRPAVERGNRQGVTLRPQRCGDEPQARADKRLTQSTAVQVGPQAQPDIRHPPGERDPEKPGERLPRR